MLQTAKEEKSENIVVVMTQKANESCKVVLDITVLPKATESTYATAIKAVNKEVSLPGFRKGKAPTSVIEKEFKKSIEHEWTQITYNLAVHEAMHLMNVQPFMRDGIKCSSITNPSLDKGAHFVIEFETHPIVPEIDAEKYQAQEVEPVAITNNDINGVVNNVRSYFATFTEITDRSVKEGDFVDLDIEKIDEPKEMLCENHRFHANAEQMAEWMRKLIIGKNVGESVEGTSEKEANESIEEFIPTRCIITIKKIYEAILPEVTDEFANKIGMPNVDALKEKITADLVERAEKTAHSKNRELLDKWLTETYPVAIPESMILNEMKGRMNTAVENWKKAGAPEEEIEGELKKRTPVFREQAENSCRLYMLLMGYSRQHKVSLTQQEVAQSASKRLLEQFQSADPAASEQEIQSLVAQAAILNKARDIIIAQAIQKNT